MAPVVRRTLGNDFSRRGDCGSARSFGFDESTELKYVADVKHLCIYVSTNVD